MWGLQTWSPDDTVCFIITREKTNSSQQIILFYVFPLEFIGGRYTLILLMPGGYLLFLSYKHSLGSIYHHDIIFYTLKSVNKYLGDYLIFNSYRNLPKNWSHTCTCAMPSKLITRVIKRNLWVFHSIQNYCTPFKQYIFAY